MKLKPNGTIRHPWPIFKIKPGNTIAENDHKAYLASADKDDKIAFSGSGRPELKDGTNHNIMTEAFATM